MSKIKGLREFLIKDKVKTVTFRDNPLTSFLSVFSLKEVEGSKVTVEVVVPSS